MTVAMRMMWSTFLLLSLAGCNRDPFKQPGTWSLPPDGQGANDSNLRSMLVNPNDLVAGAADPGSTASQSTRAIDLLVTGRRRPLPNVNASDIGNTGQQQGAQQGILGGATAGTQ
jgi:hypothetical protein